MKKLHGQMEQIVTYLNWLGALLVLVEVVWISYGVFVRYVLNSPDDMVTEATALLLVPMAFVGLGYALKLDAFPKVTLLIDLFPARFGRIFEVINMTLIMSIGGFLTLVAGSAAIRTYGSGASSDVLEWPEFIFWIPVTIFLGIFTIFTILKLLLLLPLHGGWNTDRG